MCFWCWIIIAKKICVCRWRAYTQLNSKQIRAAFTLRVRRDLVKIMYRPDSEQDQTWGLQHYLLLFFYRFCWNCTHLLKNLGALSLQVILSSRLPQFFSNTLSTQNPPVVIAFEWCVSEKIGQSLLSLDFFFQVFCLFLFKMPLLSLSLSALCVSCMRWKHEW